MERRLFQSILTIIGLCLFVSIQSCKEGTIIRSDVAPGNNILGTTLVPDTFTKITKTVFVDTMVTSDRLSGLPFYHTAGSFYDPYFGKTTAGIFFQLALPRTGFRFRAANVPYTIDSVVLVMRYSGFAFGDTTDPGVQRFVVHELTEDMSINADYYSNQRLNISSTPIGQADIDMKKLIKEFPTVGDSPSAYKHLRIRLSDDFRDKVNNQVGQAAFETEANFQSFFKGFYIGPADTTHRGDVLPYFNLEGAEDYARTAIVFYFREDGSNETLTEFFNFNRDKAASYNWISRNYSNTRAQYWIGRGISNPNQSDDTVLMQNEPGASIDIRIPNIKNLPVAPILKAELVITQALTGDPSDTLASPSRIVPWGVNDDGSLYIIQDYNSQSPQIAVDFVDGIKTADNGNIIYRINIPREVQKAITEQRKELHLRIRGSTTYPGAYRLTAGGNSGPLKVQLNIIYSKPD